MSTLEIYALANELYEASERQSGKLDPIPLHRRPPSTITAWRNAAERRQDTLKERVAS